MLNVMQILRILRIVGIKYRLLPGWYMENSCEIHFVIAMNTAIKNYYVGIGANKSSKTILKLHFKVL